MPHAPGENLVIQLWNSLVENGIGSLARPWQIRRDGEARIDVRAREVLALAQAEADALEIKNGRRRLLPDGRLIQLSQSQDDLLKLTDGRQEPVFDLQAVAHEAVSREALRALQGEVSVTRAILYAEEALAAESSSPPDRVVDHDWLEAWREFAAKASRDDARRLWGQVLAGEVKAPGAFSIRTMDFLRGLSQDEANQITKLGSLHLAGRVFKLPDHGLDAYGANFNFLLSMEELGLISGVTGSLTSSFKATSDDEYRRFFLSQNRVMAISHSDQNSKLTLDVFLFTKLGSEIMKLGLFTPDEKYLVELGELIVAKGYEVFLGYWVDAVDGKMQLTNMQRVVAKEPEKP